MLGLLWGMGRRWGGSISLVPNTRREDWLPVQSDTAHGTRVNEVAHFYFLYLSGFARWVHACIGHHGGSERIRRVTTGKGVCGEFHGE